MYEITSIEGYNYPKYLDGNTAKYDEALLPYLDGNFYPLAESWYTPDEVTGSFSLKVGESYSFNASNDAIFASENSQIGIYYDGNFSLIDAVFSLAGFLDGNLEKVDNIPIIDFIDNTSEDKKRVVHLKGYNVNLYDQIQYLPNDIIVVKGDTEGYYEWSSPLENGNFLVKSRFNSFSKNTHLLSLGKDHTFISNYPVSRDYNLKSHFDAYVVRGIYGSSTTKTSRSRPLNLATNVNQFAPIQNIVRDLNNEEDQYKLSPANMYVKIVNDETVAVYSASGVLQRFNQNIQAIPTAIDLSLYPEVTAPFVFVNPLAKPLTANIASLPNTLIEWPWVTTDGLTISLSRTEQVIKGVIKYVSKYYWCTLHATYNPTVYKITSMSEIKEGFDFEYYRYNFVVMEEHNRTSYVTK